MQQSYPFSKRVIMSAVNQKNDFNQFLSKVMGFDDDFLTMGYKQAHDINLNRRSVFHFI